MQHSSPAPERPQRFLPRRQSITARLVWMSAASALFIFALTGIVLYTVLKEELLRHERDGLVTTLNDISFQISRAGNTERWSRVQLKLAALSQADQRVSFWISGDDERFRYGDLSRLQHETIEHDNNAVGMLRLAGKEYPLHTMTRTLPAFEERPEVRVTVGIDTEPYFAMRRTFLMATFMFSLLGIVLAVISSYWIARAGLAPLRRMSAHAQGFSPRKLSARMPVGSLPEELSVLAHAFNGALERIEDAYTQLEAFNADVAHELRTPLANLIGETQVALARERSAGEFKDVLQSNLEELDRIRSIINDMLFLARSDQGEAATSLVHARVADEVQKTVDFFEFVLDDAGMDIAVSGDIQSTAMMETALFRRALTNLIQNAIQHSPAGALIRIDIAAQEDGVRIAVTNPGQPIDARHLPRLFDRFYRVDTARQDINGSHGHGLGLAIVKAVARMHGGRAFASSADGCNSIGFTISQA
ncbi:MULTISPECIES: heavy metal sensor histidine kinase [unclassified Herbaspirillum]|uniref:heavy metal sensor histidine kinase n=1 Tax=unclassified Herbaspirillum TaxID=2624150 RepID=UPI00115127D9|nr:MULTISPECIES: heavy metal sensor histidine kinase [unclassified Herbaspirillum]MBB5393295.1 two-component system heavy metal sensor histidine kinase CusS [Herbaspirillum sp. SJZ102]TQK03956.1 two-component system heavy metal sensor histidine kinase CusS [Herbaspirillum sp. SJZ130]TQK08688.1 two-component system heavy metal sensor histidine kinase CusS [Herbaspirillum sp. SJZ106]TWC71959.1 two-component system heavy metal sensor histidine kinase CusS [Herbaspirillum sp. SJZ099]